MSKRSPDTMQPEKTPSRQDALRAAVASALHASLTSDDTTKQFQQSFPEYAATPDAAPVDTTLQRLSQLAQKISSAAMDAWFADNGLDRRLQLVDELSICAPQSFADNDSYRADVVNPDPHLPGTTYSRIRLDAKRAELQRLGQVLDDRKAKAEQMRAKIVTDVQTASHLCTQLDSFSIGTDNAPMVSTKGAL